MVTEPTGLTATSAATVTPALRINGGSGAKAALDPVGHRPVARSGTAEGELGASRLRRLARELAIGRHLAPVLVAAVGEVVEDRPGNRRDRLLADGRTPAAHREPARQPARGVQAEGRAAAEDEPVQRLDDAAGIERRGVDGEWRAPAHVDGGQHRTILQEHGDTAPRSRIVRVADGEPGNVGDTVARPGCDHCVRP